MYKGFKLLIIFLTLTLLNGCASSCGSETASNTNGNTNVLVPKRADNAPDITQGNTNMVNGMKNSNGKNPTLDKSKVEVVNTNTAKIEAQKKPLPENSELTTSMGKDGSFIEVRKFQEDPDIDRVERILKSPKDIKIKVYLKNGRIYELDDSKLKNFRVDTSTTIMNAIGVKQTEIDNSGGKTKEQLKAEQMTVKPNIPKQ